MKTFNHLSLSGQHLLVFVTLHEVGTVTATAEKLDLTQSAVSHSLQKLRDIFADELFVRAGRSVTPTVRSKELYPEIKSMLERLSELTHSQAFDPTTANIDYKISANDYQSNLLLPQLYSKVSAQVQALSLEISPSKKPTIELLRSNKVDLAISPMPPDHSDIIFSDISHCFYDANIRSAPNTLDELSQGKFVSLTFMKGLSLAGNKNKTVNQVIQMLDDNTVIRVANFASIPSFILGTELMAVLPSQLSKTLGYDRLAHAPLPYQASQLNLYMLWHKRYQNDAKHKWFREQMLELSLS